MKRLSDILYKVPILEVAGNISLEIEDFFFDSRIVTKGSLFIAIKGSGTDGHNYISDAIERGAVAIVCEEIPVLPSPSITWIRVKNSTLSLGFISANYFGNPAQELKIVGVTGTNGKTTTATVLFTLFNSLGHKSGLLSTVAIRIGEETIEASHTTPDAKSLHALFREMIDKGCEYCFMEVSSHSLVQNRVAGIPFRLGIFTNITHDHLDYHGTFKEYIRAKKLFFDGLGEQAIALVNADDKNSGVMVQNTRAMKRTFAIKQVADYKAKVIENSFEGLLLEIDGFEAWFRMIGRFNAYNLLAVYSAAVLLGEEPSAILIELSRIDGVEGRFQTVHPIRNNITAIVDYAHTPDALRNVLETISEINSRRGKIFTVVGCGGNRDKEKRPVMARIAVELSDLVILTSDNPRDEEPSIILEQMMLGITITQKKKVMTIESRSEAISVACRMATEHDIILVAGKGHEKYQEIKGVKHPFDDRQILIETFKTLSA